jgi:hypothetical protein
LKVLSLCAGAPSSIDPRASLEHMRARGHRLTASRPLYKHATSTAVSASAAAAGELLQRAAALPAADARTLLNFGNFLESVHKDYDAAEAAYQRCGGRFLHLSSHTLCMVCLS